MQIGNQPSTTGWNVSYWFSKFNFLYFSPISSKHFSHFYVEKYHTTETKMKQKLYLMVEMIGTSDRIKIIAISYNGVGIRFDIEVLMIIGAKITSIIITTAISFSPFFISRPRNIVIIEWLCLMVWFLARTVQSVSQSAHQSVSLSKTDFSFYSWFMPKPLCRSVALWARTTRYISWQAELRWVIWRLHKRDVRTTQSTHHHFVRK